jgi:hypothetical protein
VDGQDDSAQSAKEEVPARSHPEGDLRCGHEYGQGRGGEDDPAQDEQGRGEGDPPGEQSREPEQEDCQVNGRKASTARGEIGHGVRDEAHYTMPGPHIVIFPICVKMFFTFKGGSASLSGYRLITCHISY